MVSRRGKSVSLNPHVRYATELAGEGNFGAVLRPRAC